MRRPIPFRALAATAFPAVFPLLGGCISTATYGTGEAPEMAIFREIAGTFGSDKEEIEYQPRAPLVLPPSAEALPAPVETAAISDPDWPVPPEAPTPSNFDNPERDVSPEYAERLAPLAGLFSAAPSSSVANDKRNVTYDVIGKKQELSAFRTAVNDENAGDVLAGRQYLTQPPDTYMEPAPTAPTEFEDIDKKKNSIFCITCWF